MDVASEKMWTPYLMCQVLWWMVSCMCMTFMLNKTTNPGYHQWLSEIISSQPNGGLSPCLHHSPSYLFCQITQGSSKTKGGGREMARWGAPRPIRPLLPVGGKKSIRIYITNCDHKLECGRVFYKYICGWNSVDCTLCMDMPKCKWKEGWDGDAMYVNRWSYLVTIIININIKGMCIQASLVHPRYIAIINIQKCAFTM